MNERLLQQKTEIKRQELERMKDLDEEQRKRIMEQHTNELRALEDALDAERERQKQSLIAQASQRAAKRREMQLRKKQAKLREKARRQREERKRKREELKKQVMCARCELSPVLQCTRD